MIVSEGATEPVTSTKWEYRVIHINVESKEPKQPQDPQEASEKLHGVLSPEFISREFPDQYAKNPPPQHPAHQLQHYLNLLGKEGWDMVEAPRIGDLLMFIFKRPLREPPAKLARATSTGGVATPDAAAVVTDVSL